MGVVEKTKLYMLKKAMKIAEPYMKMGFEYLAKEGHAVIMVEGFQFITPATNFKIIDQTLLQAFDITQLIQSDALQISDELLDDFDKLEQEAIAGLPEDDE